MALLRDACSQQAGLCASSIVGAHTPASKLQAYLRSVTLGLSFFARQDHQAENKMLGVQIVLELLLHLLGGYVLLTRVEWSLVCSKSNELAWG